MSGPRLSMAEARMMLSGIRWDTVSTRCFYCEEDVPSEAVQFDHFPIPSSLGGENVVPSCLACHNYKDRLSWRMVLDWWASYEKRYAADDPEGRWLGFSNLILTSQEISFLKGDFSLGSTGMLLLLDDIKLYPPPVRVSVAKAVQEMLWRLR